MIALRPYQEAAARAVIRGFTDYDRQLAVKPTGSGKTIVVAKIVEHFQPGRTLVLAHREELLEQARDKIWQATGIVAEIEAAERAASLDASVVVASVQTLMREARRRRWPADHFKLVVVDEAHHVLADSYQRVLAHFEGNGSKVKVLGVTATPDRGDKRLLAGYFENIAYEAGLVDLVKAGYLARIRVRTIPLRIDLSGVHMKAGDYDAGELGHAIEPYLEQIADIVAAEFSRRKSLVFLPLVSLSECFAQLCRERAIAAEHVDGGSRDRSGVLERFRSGETTLVSNAMLWVEGFDEPSIDCVIPLRPTRIRSLFSQQIGRGTRIHPGKSELLVLDFLWQTQKHDLIHPVHLVAADEEETQEIKRQLSRGGGDLLDAMCAATAERLERLARQLERNKRRKAQEYDLLEFALVIGDAEIAEFAPVMRWHCDPVTQKQFDLLERAGISPCAVKGKGHASFLIDRIMQRRAAGLATYKQVRFLVRHNVPNAHKIAFEKAGELISELIGSGRKSSMSL